MNVKPATRSAAKARQIATFFTRRFPPAGFPSVPADPLLSHAIRRQCSGSSAGMFRPSRNARVALSEVRRRSENNWRVRVVRRVSSANTAEVRQRFSLGVAVREPMGLWCSCPCVVALGASATRSRGYVPFFGSSRRHAAGSSSLVPESRPLAPWGADVSLSLAKLVRYRDCPPQPPTDDDQHRTSSDHHRTDD